MTTSELTFAPREVEVIYLLAQGKNFNEVAAALGLSPRTCRAYAESARKKLGLKYARELPMAYKEATGDSPWPE